MSNTTTRDTTTIQKAAFSRMLVAIDGSDASMDASRLCYLYI